MRRPQPANDADLSAAEERLVEDASAASTAPPTRWQ